jgi:hypothetical protein
LEATTPQITIEEDLKADLPAILKLAAVQMTAGADSVELKETSIEKCPRCWNHGTLSSTFGTCVRCESVLQKNERFISSKYSPKQP